jgi:hypothetical protein
LICFKESAYRNQKLNGSSLITLLRCIEKRFKILAIDVTVVAIMETRPSVETYTVIYRICTFSAMAVLPAYPADYDLSISGCM